MRDGARVWGRVRVEGGTMMTSKWTVPLEEIDGSTPLHKEGTIILAHGGGQDDYTFLGAWRVIKPFTKRDQVAAYRLVSSLETNRRMDSDARTCEAARHLTSLGFLEPIETEEF